MLRFLQMVGCVVNGFNTTARNYKQKNSELCHNRFFTNRIHLELKFAIF